MEGQLTIFDNAKIVWMQYPGCTKGFCSVCGTLSWYGTFPTQGSWIEDARTCPNCKSQFAEDKPPEHLPVRSGLDNKVIAFDKFCENCRHRGWYRKSTETEPGAHMCGYANKRLAQCWADWIPCTEDNCPLLKGD